MAATATSAATAARPTAAARSGGERTGRPGGCPLTWRPKLPLFHAPAGRTAAAAQAGFAAIARGGGKSGLQGSTVAANSRRGRPQGKCHREQTAGAGQPAEARVKRCGKSAPRCRQRQRHGKPQREQDRIGAARVSGATPASSAILARRPGWLLEVRSNPRPRGMAVAEGQPSRQNPAYRPAGKYASDAVQRTRVLARLGPMTTVTLEKAQQDLPLLVERAL